MVIKNHLQLYLDRYAETFSKTIATDINKALTSVAPFNHCIVIPAYNETIGFIERLKNSTLARNKLLIITIINQPDTDNDTTKNQQLWSEIKKTGNNVNSSDNYQLINWPQGNAYLLAVNCFKKERQLPTKQGVGLARKLGCDIACSLIQQQHLKTQWIHTTDADTQLPDDYLTQTSNDDIIQNNTSAAIYPFTHKGSDQVITIATLLYEQALNYYVDGLRYAQSPYAYHTLGSCIAFRATSYAQARGFPKRAGGEDFYLLNKLAKLGAIKQLNSHPLLIEARVSNRAPFGTGPAVEKIARLENPEASYLYYNPKLFIELKDLLSTFKQLFDYRNNLEGWLNLQTKETAIALEKIEVGSLFKHIQAQSKNKSLCMQQAHHWFDGFRTLKFLHYLERYYPRIALKEAVKEFYGNKEISD